MTMTAEGLVKLMEECGELVQIAAKRVAYYNTDTHPDGAGSMSHRLEEEVGDVLAAIDFVIGAHGLNHTRVKQRKESKLTLYRRWASEQATVEQGILR
jgi:NTP pyrophosphatase (non-canonical NTP hydrolase)